MRSFRTVIFFVILFVAGAIHTTDAGKATDFADSVWSHIYRNFEFLPEYHLEADIFTFFFHKNGYFKERYYLEADTMN